MNGSAFLILRGGWAMDKVFWKSGSEIEWLKRHCLKDEFRNVRIESEKKARAMLDAGITTMDADRFRLFCASWNWECIPPKPKKRNKRFELNYPNTLRIVEDVDGFWSFIEWLSIFWKKDYISESLARKHYDDFMSRRIRFAKIFVVTLMFYLKDANQFNVCTDNLAKGLIYLKDKSSAGMMLKGFDDYLEFNKLANTLKHEFELRPQDVDYVLSNGIHLANGSEKKQNDSC